METNTASIGGSATIVNATCPTGTYATGGGYSTNNVTVAGTVGQSFPIGGSTTSPPTGWQATGFGGTGGTLTTYVICSS